MENVRCNTDICFAWLGGRCTILKESYPGKVCPFFKTQAQLDRDTQESDRRLRIMIISKKVKKDGETN